jgi:uncharacterized membrane protein
MPQQGTLTLLIVVRIHVPQPKKPNSYVTGESWQAAWATNLPPRHKFFEGHSETARNFEILLSP